VVLTTPLVRAIRTRHPGAWITFVTKTSFIPLLETNPRINEVVGYDPAKSLIPLANRLNHSRFTHRLDLHGSVRSRLLRVLVPGRWYGYSKQRLARATLIRLKRDRYRDRRPVPERYFDAAAALEVSPDQQGPEMFVRQDALERAATFLSSRRLGRSGSLIAVAPGARHPTKRWPFEHWRKLVNDLTDQGWDVVVLGSADETELAAAVAIAGGERAVSVAGTVPLGETAAFLKLARAMVAGDTGLMHLATAVRTPVVALYGPTVQAFGFFPYHANAKVLERLDLSCRPCSAMGSEACPLGHHQCLASITPEQVLGAVLEPFR
jgi:heptosyltransferase-2